MVFAPLRQDAPGRGPLHIGSRAAGPLWCVAKPRTLPLARLVRWNPTGIQSGPARGHAAGCSHTSWQNASRCARGGWGRRPVLSPRALLRPSGRGPEAHPLSPDGKATRATTQASPRTAASGASPASGQDHLAHPVPRGGEGQGKAVQHTGRRKRKGASGRASGWRLAHVRTLGGRQPRIRRAYATSPSRPRGLGDA
jgi:hypothetical protein